MGLRWVPTRALPAGAWLVILSLVLGAAPEWMEPLPCVERLQEQIARCRDYQYDVTSYERLGKREERRTYRLFVKDCCQVRITVTEGRGKGSEAAMDAAGRIRGRKGGLLKSFDRGMKPEDARLRSLRGRPFWETAAHNYLRKLRERMTQPTSRCSVETDSDAPGSLRLVVRYPPAILEQYWIETREMRLTRGEVYETGQLVERFELTNMREDVGLKDGFFSF